VLFYGAYAHFRTGSFAVGIALVDAIGRLADAANHHPDVDLRHEGVTVRLSTHDFGGLSERDVALARRISAAAIAAGGHLISDEHAPEWWTLANAEGNEVDVATWMGRD
jgi:4a-hydroxytetrahydrobiopterin dehydratase